MFLVVPRRRINATMLILAVVAVLPLAAQQSSSSSDQSSAAVAEVLKFERDMESAVVRGDVVHLERICTPDFTFTHGDGWTLGNPPLKVENKTEWLASLVSAPYESRDLGTIKVELHGDIAITYGNYHAKMKTGDPSRREFTVWFERVYARKNGSWQFVSHRTVRGPTYGTQ